MVLAWLVYNNCLPELHVRNRPLKYVNARVRGIWPNPVFQFKPHRGIGTNWTVPWMCAMIWLKFKALWVALKEQTISKPLSIFVGLLDLYKDLMMLLSYQPQKVRIITTNWQHCKAIHLKLSFPKRPSSKRWNNSQTILDCLCSQSCKVYNTWMAKNRY